MALSEQEVMTRLYELEGEEEVDRRAALTGERYLSLFLNKIGGRSYIFLHGLDQLDGFSTGDAELWEYPDPDDAERAYAQMLAEFRESGELVDEDSMEDIADPKVDGADPDDLAELRNSGDEDPLLSADP